MRANILFVLRLKNLSELRNFDGIKPQYAPRYLTNSIENGIIAWYNIDMKTRIYMTKMHQQWTYGEREDLLPYLDGEDDEIFEYAIENRNFAIILKNDTTYDVCDTEDEAIEKIAYIYRNYAVVQNDKDLCYIARDDTDKRYKTPADAQADGVFDYVYVPRDMFFLSKFGKIIAIGHSEDEMCEKMYEHYRAKYTYLY